MTVPRNALRERAGRRALWLGAALTACGSTSTGEADSASSEDPAATSLCPACVAGGETTDFSGDRVCGVAHMESIEQDGALAGEYGADSVLSRLAQPLRSSVGWRRGAGGSRVTGYERETEVEIRVEVLGLSHAELRHEDTGDPCGDFLQLDARIHIETTDGALKNTFARPLSVQRGSDTASATWLGIEGSSPPVDLRQFTGTLDLKLDAERPHSGSVGLSLSVGPDRLSGELYVFTRYLDQDGGLNAVLAPMRAQLPSDGCDPEYVRVAPDASINPVDGRSARDYWDRRRQSLDAVYPMSAAWLDGSVTDVDLELGELESACMSPTGLYGYVNGPLEVRSADGRLATVQLARVAFRTDEDAFEYVTVEGEPTARAGFVEEVSAPGIEWADDFEARFELYSRHDEGGAPSGSVNVIGFDGEGHNRLYLSWCSRGDCTGNVPGPKTRY